MHHVHAGLAPQGLLVLMPTSMHLSASSFQPPASLTLALSIQALPFQLSPAAVASLYSIGKALHTSAVAPGQPCDQGQHAQLLAQQQTGSDQAQTHAQAQEHAAASPEAVSHRPVQLGSEASDFSSQRVTEAATAVSDDLRCGLFSMASVPAARPGGGLSEEPSC